VLKVHFRFGHAAPAQCEAPGQRGEAPLVVATPDQHDNNLRGLTFA
jgi:hypothetical protein